MKYLTQINSVARPKSQHEPDLLIGNASKGFVAKDMDGQIVVYMEAPECGWTHDLLESLEVPSVIYQNGCDFFLGDNWIGSSEV